MRTPDLLRVERHIRRLAGRAIGDFDLIRNNDRILVALSGGKDSWTLLHILSSLQRAGPGELFPHCRDGPSRVPGFQTETMEAYLAAKGYDHRVVHAPIHDTMLENSSPMTFRARSAPASGAGSCTRRRRNWAARWPSATTGRTLSRRSS